MLEFCVAELSGWRWMLGNLSFNEVFDSFNKSLVKLCRMISLHKMRDQLLWNDILVKKVGGTPPPQQML